MKYLPIKWTGSKQMFSTEIISMFPKEIDVYYEPFVGSGAIVCELLKTNHNIKKFVCSDINSDLINLYNDIKNNCDKLIVGYKSHWTEMNKTVHYYD